MSQPAETYLIDGKEYCTFLVDCEDCSKFWEDKDGVGHCKLVDKEEEEL